MAAMTMFFLALTAAYLERHGLNTDWLSPELLRIRGANTGLLLASSLALWRAGEFRRLQHVRQVLRWLGLALGFGIAFLAGQALAWRYLLEAGVFIHQNPDSGFFYLVTAAHALHLTIALGLLIWLFARAWRGRLRAERPLPLDLTAIVWHCLDITWLYIFGVLLLYR